MLLGRRQYKRRLLMHKSPARWHTHTRTSLTTPRELGHSKQTGSSFVRRSVTVLHHCQHKPGIFWIFAPSEKCSDLGLRQSRKLESDGRSKCGRSLQPLPAVESGTDAALPRSIGTRQPGSESPPRPRREAQRLAVHLPWGGLGEGKDSPLQGLTGGYGLHPVLLCRNKVRVECLPGSRVPGGTPLLAPALTKKVLKASKTSRGATGALMITRRSLIHILHFLYTDRHMFHHLLRTACTFTKPPQRLSPPASATRPRPLHGAAPMTASAPGFSRIAHTVMRVRTQG